MAATREEARRLATEAAAGRWRGPLHGVPVAVKDLFDLTGEVTTAGSLVPPTGRPAVRDAAAVAMLRRAGAIVVGQTRTHEYAWGLTTQHESLGRTRNPHDDPGAPRLERWFGEDVPSLVELGWRFGVNPTRRLRQFR